MVKGERYLLTCFVQPECLVGMHSRTVMASEIGLRVTVAQQHLGLISATGNCIRLKSALNNGDLYICHSRNCLGGGQSLLIILFGDLGREHG